MIRRVRDKHGRIVRLDMTADEAAKLLDVTEEQLADWAELLPFQTVSDTAIYSFRNQEEMTLYRQRAAILKTQCRIDVVKDMEERGLLSAYAGLAEDCPPGLSVLEWRSYAIVVLMQMKARVKLTPAELAKRANLVEVDSKGEVQIDIQSAERHLRMLTSLNYLEEGEDHDGRSSWIHKGLPKCMRGE